MSAALNIIQLTDLHIRSESGETMEGVDTEASFRKILDYAVNRHSHIDLILLTGDLAQNPSHSSYQRINRILEKYPIRTLCLAGNHDDFSVMQVVFNNKQINCDHSLLLKDWNIICLNSKKEGSQGGYLAKEELDYLTQCLNQQTNVNTLIAVHHHPIPTQSPWMDRMIIENHEALFSILRHYPQVKAISCGHIHQSMESKQDNILIFGAPSTCFQFKPLCTQYTLDDKKPGYRYFSLYSDGKIETEVIRFNPQ